MYNVSNWATIFSTNSELSNSGELIEGALVGVTYSVNCMNVGNVSMDISEASRIEQSSRERFSQILKAIRLNINCTLGSPSWKHSCGAFRTSKTRYFLLDQMMPYLFSLWFSNIIGSVVNRPYVYKEKVENS